MPPQSKGSFAGSPLDVLDHLYAAGLDVHRALRFADAGPARHLESAVDHINRTITITLRTSLVWAVANQSELGRTLDEALTQDTTEPGLAGYLSTLAKRACELRYVEVAAFTLTETSDRLSVVVPDQVTVWDLCHLRPSPTWDTCVHGRRHHLDDLATDRRWPVFATRAKAAGYHAVHTLPLHRRQITLGALTLFSIGDGTPRQEDSEKVRRLADLATTGILLHHAETVVTEPGAATGPPGP